MPSLNTVKAKVGEDVYLRVEKEAEKEVSLAMQMPLVGENQQAKYYQARDLLPELRPAFDSFERVGIKISPLDLAIVIFRCKLLRACATEHEFGQRCGGLYPILTDAALIVRWSERNNSVDANIEKHLTDLHGSMRERIMLSPLNSFTSAEGDSGHQTSFEKLIASLGFPFVCFFDGDHLVELHRRLDPGFPAYDLNRAKEFFCSPSLGFKANGSRNYCFWYSTAWLRTLLHLLRIACFISPGQMGFGWPEAELKAPTFPVFLGERAQGFYKWDEDKRESWMKIPDGSLFLSFGFRGLTKGWFDRRNLPKIEKFLVDHRAIFDPLKNPWSLKATRDIAPTLDILSSATQIPDVGAKILLIYCCLEHLFVPTNIKTDNRKYIVGGMHALAPHFLPWFDRLYNLRCDYAHKGFVLREDSTTKLIMDSISNVMALLVAKLSVS